jgi:CRP/FNR family transcriptional regulator
MTGISDMFEIKAMLQQHAGLQSINGPEWDAALADATLVRIPRNTTLTRDGGTASTHFSIVLSGGVKIHSVSKDGRTFSIYRVKAGELCVLSLPAVHMPRRLLVQMSTEGEVLRLNIPVKHLSHLLANSLAFRRYLMASISAHAATLINRIEESTFAGLHTRILSHLREICAGSGCSNIPISHQELADELGSTREAVSRALKELERSGAVKLGRRMIALAGNRVPGSTASYSADGVASG